MKNRLAIKVGVELFRKFGVIQRCVGNLKFRVIHGCCLFMSGGEYGYSAGRHSQRLGICKSIAMRIPWHIAVS
jgi:hypothetical protein